MNTRHLVHPELVPYLDALPRFDLTDETLPEIRRAEIPVLHAPAVANVTREEVVINFGVNKTWDMGSRDLEVQLEHRIILSPYAAKRLQELLTKLIDEHETRYGALR